MTDPQQTMVTRAEARSGVFGACVATALCLLLLLVSKLSRWRGKRMKQLPKPPSVCIKIKRGPFGFFKLKFKHTD